MIVREVVDCPELIETNFDYYNDAIDTISWLRGRTEWHPLAERLQKASDAYWLARRENYNRTITRPDIDGSLTRFVPGDICAIDNPRHHYHRP